MVDAKDPHRELWLALANAESLDQVLGTYGRIEEVARSGELTIQQAVDLRVQAFSEMARVVGDDAASARSPIMELLLPRCLAAPENQDEKRDGSRYREILGEWLESLRVAGDSSIRDEVVGSLIGALETSDFENSCRALGSVGLRNVRIVEGLWSIANREPGEPGDVAISVLVGLGEGLNDRERILEAIHARAKERRNYSLLFAIERMGEPASLDVVEEAWFRDSDPQFWSLESWVYLRVMSYVADANPNNPDVQDRAWAILRALTQRHPGVGSGVILGGDLTGMCDSPRVIPDLLGMLESRAGDSDQSKRSRYIVYCRARECSRPRQLEGWSAPIGKSTLDIILKDAIADTGTEGYYRTTEMDLKRHAWDVLLSLGREEMLSIGVFEDAIPAETSPFVRSNTMEWLACFRYTEIPPSVRRWVTEQRRIDRDDPSNDLTFRTASTRLLRSSETREAFDILLRTDYSLGDSALLNSLDTLSDVAHVLADRGDASIAEALVEVLASADSGRNRRVAAADALIELAATGRIPDHLVPPIWEAALDPERDDPEKSRIVRVLGHLSRPELLPDLESKLVEWSKGSGQVALRAVEALARHGFLADRPELVESLLGLEDVGGRWTLSSSSRMSDVNGFAIAILFCRTPDRYEHAIAEYLRSKDWVITAQVIARLDEFREDGNTIPPTVVDALLARIRARQTAYTTETKLFDTLRSWSPRKLVEEQWHESWTPWMPDARRALADALGRLNEIGQPESDRAISELLLLTRDGVYAVRRSAYRAIARLSPDSLRTFSLTCADSRLPELRRRGAEASGWIAEDHFEAVHHAFGYDSEETVREVARRSVAERRTRKFASMSLERVLSVTEGSSGEMLAAWPFGRALVRYGDDSIEEVLREHALSRVFKGHIAYWLGRIIDGLKEQWRKVTEKWPEPWYSWDGALMQGRGRLIVSGDEGIPVEYCVVQNPPDNPAGTHAWHGAIWATDTHLPIDWARDSATLLLSDGKRGRIQGRSLSFDRILFTGTGPYPD